MRLTLRTLLAYLDDVLEPAQTKEIGTRVSESPAAAATVARIKEVVRRRRIAAPELTGSGSAPDPNLVAEYLDNTLAPDAVPALEKLCLESDMHLAEAAASHQILTAVLGEPIEVPMSTRERMYALVSPIPLTPEPVASIPDTSAQQGTAGAPAPAVVNNPSTLAPRSPLSPDYLKPSIGRNVLLGLGAIVLLGGWLTWVMRDQGLLPTKATAPSDVAAVNEPSDTPEPASEAVAPASASNTIATTEPAQEPPAAVATQEIAKTDPPSPDMPAEPQPVADPVAAAPAAVPPVAAQPVVPMEKPQEVVPTVEFPSALYSNAEGILIVKDSRDGQWNVLSRRALLHAGDEIAAPIPFPSVINLGNSNLDLTLYPGTRLKLEAGKPNQLLSISMDRGRISLRRPSEEEKPGSVKIGLSIRGQAAELSLAEPGTQCGLEVIPRPAQGKRADGVGSWPEGGISVVMGTVQVSWAGSEPLQVGSDIGWSAWPVPQAAMKVGPMRAIPHWLAPEGTPLTAADKKLHQLFEKEFSTTQPVSLSIPALVQDRREGISEFATETLALVDDIPPLVKALQSEHDKTRLAAIRGLRGWLPTDPNNSAVLEVEVGRVFPDEDVPDIVELLWGFSLADARDETSSRKLIQWMDHSELAIRELAHFQVALLTGRPYAHGYRPTLPDAARHAALMGWHAQLERNSGKLLK